MKKITLTSILICISFFSALADQLAAGSRHSLALKEDGTVWGWGGNSSGELGDGTTEPRLTPVKVSGLTDVISVSAGASYSLALKRDGTVWTWGWNEYGQLGDGTDEERHTPVQVVGLSGVIAIDGGDSYSLALKNDGTAWAWGANFFGALGDGTTTHRATPVQVIGLLDGTAVSAGQDHSLALKRDGTVWAWGWNGDGQLGDGTTSNRLTPVQGSGLTNVISISAGGFHSLALKRDGTVWAWGLNFAGQLGDGNGGTSYTNSLTPVQSLVSGVIDIKGEYFYSLALASYGTVWFWGYMPLDMNDIISIIPVPVDGISSVKAIAGGYNHALALKNDGTVWAWGGNSSGQLGDGTTTKRRYPVQVNGFSTGGSVSVPSAVLAADFDADGRADPTAITGTLSAGSGQEWYFWYSSQSYTRAGPIGLGMTGTPAAGDVDGDGRADMALVDNSGNWYFWLSSRGYAQSGPHAFEVSGPGFAKGSAEASSPVLGDFDGDGKSDPAIVDSSGTWFVRLSADGYSQVSAPFAVSGGTPLAGDFDGDGRADPVMVSASGGWYLWLSKSLYIRAGPYNFGLTGPGFAQASGSAEASKPAAGDFDGDGKADPAMMNSSGNWYFWLSGSFYTRDGPYYLVLP